VDHAPLGSPEDPPPARMSRVEQIVMIAALLSIIMALFE
jgi:hypothetical protein